MNRLDYALASLRRAGENGYSWSVSPDEAGALVAEVERLTALLAAARVAVDVWPVPAHSFYCGYWLGPEGYDSRLCDCDVEQRKGDRTHARRAVGLEGSHG